MHPRSLLLLLSRIVMEGAWLTSLIAFFSLMTGMTLSAMPAVASYGVLSVSFVASYVMQHLEVEEQKLRIAGLLLAVATINGTAKLLVTGQPDFWNLLWPLGYLGGGAGTADQGRQTALALAFGVMLWWRGAKVAEETPNFTSILMTFRAGVMFVAFQCILEAIAPIRDGATGMVLPFFVGGLAALALAHLERIDRMRAIRMTGHNAALPAGVIAALAAVGVMLSLLPFSAMGSSIARVGQAFEAATYFVFYFVLLFVGYLAELVIAFGNWVLSAVRLPMRLHNPFAQGLLDRLREQPPDPGMPDTFYDVMRVGLLIALGMVVVFILLRAFQRRRQDAALVDLEFHEEAGEGMGGPGYLPSWLRRFWAGLGADSAISRSLGEVIRLYLQLLQWAARVGLPRSPSRTPFEFQQELHRTFGLHEGAIARLTRAFTSARYGRKTVPAEEIRQLEQDLRDIRGTHPSTPPNTGGS